jgi:CHASE3 domain sensor protein
MSPDGTKWPPQRNLATGYTVAIGVLIIDLLITFWNLNSISRIWDALALSHDVVVGLDDVLSNLRDAETGQRGYLLTGDGRYPTLSSPLRSIASDRSSRTTASGGST